MRYIAEFQEQNDTLHDTGTSTSQVKIVAQTSSGIRHKMTYSA